MSRRICAAGVDLVIEFEGFLPWPYPDPASAMYRAAPRAPWGHRDPREILAGLDPSIAKLSAAPWTQGIGFTHGITIDSPKMSRDQAERRLEAELSHYGAGVERALTREANDHQYAAMVALAFNIGIGGFSKSSVCRLHNAGKHQEAANAFSLWNKAGGRVMRGLTRRRAAEAALYLRPVKVAPLSVPPIERMPVERVDAEQPEVSVSFPAYEPEMPELEDAQPKVVDRERPIHQSRIVQGSAVSGGVAGLTLAAEGARAIGEIKFSLGDWLPYIALGVIVCTAGWVIWERIKQRRSGVA